MKTMNAEVRPATREPGAGIVQLIVAALVLALGCLSPAPAAEAPAAPELLGPASPEQILGISAEWKSEHDAYAPYDAALDQIRAASGPAATDLGIEVVFGSWCSDSREQIPRLIKVLELLGKDDIHATYVGVQKAKQERGEIVTKLKLTAVPTIIVTRKGTEIGRIVETPQASIEEDLAAILSGPATP